MTTKTEALPAFAYSTLTSDDITGFVDNARNGCSKSIEKLIDIFLPIIKSQVRKYGYVTEYYDDLLQEGIIALLYAVRKFDENKSPNFRMYAYYWIKQAIARTFEKMGNTIRIPIRKKQVIKKLKYRKDQIDEDAENHTEYLLFDYNFVSLERISAYNPDDLSLAEKIADDDNPLSNLERKQMDDICGDLLASLSDRERDVIRKRFGLCDEDTKTLKEIGEEYNLTSESIRKIEKKALEKLKKMMTEQELTEIVR